MTWSLISSSVMDSAMMKLSMIEPLDRSWLVPMTPGTSSPQLTL